MRAWLREAAPSQAGIEEGVVCTQNLQHRQSQRRTLQTAWSSQDSMQQSKNPLWSSPTAPRAHLCLPALSWAKTTAAPQHQCPTVQPPSHTHTHTAGLERNFFYIQEKLKRIFHYVQDSVQSLWGWFVSRDFVPVPGWARSTTTVQAKIEAFVQISFSR